MNNTTQITPLQWDVLYTSMQIVQYYGGTDLELSEQLQQKWGIDSHQLEETIERCINELHRIHLQQSNTCSNHLSIATSQHQNNASPTN